MGQAPGLVHRVFTRQGGVSLAPFDCLNTGKRTGDDSQAVMENRRRILGALGAEKALYLNQVHGADILVLSRKDREKADLETAHTADGVVTNIPGVALVIQVADCQAVMLHDPAKRVIANVHSGWRGSIKNIIGQCVNIMVQDFGCRPKEIMAGISPSLGPCCAQFINYKEEIPETLWKYKLPDRDYFDFWALSRDQLLETGVLDSNIENMNICTRCSQDRFFSYRGQRITGRFACGLSLVGPG